MSTDRPIERIVARLTKPRKQGRSWMARCPAHDDTVQSLSASEGKDGRAVLHCHAGCQTADIVAALGLTMQDLFAESRPAVFSPPPAKSERSALGPIVRTYDYTDAQGTVLYQVTRHEPKDFRQRRPDGHGGWVWGLEGVTLTLYRLPDVLEAIALGKPIYVVEGEKDAETLIEMGYPATTNAAGAKKWSDAFADILKGATVYVLPDNDKPGKQHGETVAEACQARGCLVKVIDLPGLPEKGDVTDWFDAGHDLDEFDAVVNQAPVWVQDPANKTRWRLDELWANNALMQPPPVVVPRLAWAGRSTLFAAREKAGKSTLTGYVTACVTNGAPFLDDPCRQGDVLLIGLEEFIGDAARRLHHFGADATRVHVVDRFKGDPRERFDQLAAHIHAVRPALVIVDSLAAYSIGLIQSANDDSQMSAVMQPLTNIAHETGCALLIIHHARKSDGKARGSTAITAGTDVVVEMLIPDEQADPTLRRLSAVGRVPVPRSTDLRFDGDTFALVQNTDGSAPVEQRIAHIVRNRPGCSVRDVVEAIGGRWSTTQNAIAKMKASGELIDLSNGQSRAMRLALPSHQPHQTDFAAAA